MDKKTMFKLTYGLFVLTTSLDGKDNGCIINTLSEVASDPLVVSFAVNKLNHTHDMLMKAKMFNVSIINDDAKFDMFKQFGFQSGKDVDKFKNINYMKRSDNDIYYIDNGQTNAYISGWVYDTVDLGSHTLFLAKVVDAVTLNNVPSLTYAGYHDHVKEKLTPTVNAEGKTVWVCSVCGYEYVGETLPDDFICPVCKHGKEVFYKKN